MLVSPVRVAESLASKAEVDLFQQRIVQVLILLFDRHFGFRPGRRWCSRFDMDMDLDIYYGPSPTLCADGKTEPLDRGQCAFWDDPDLQFDPNQAAVLGSATTNVEVMLVPECKGRQL